MRQEHTLPVLGVLLVLSICPLTAQTTTRKTGDALVYEIVVHSQLSGGHLPSQAYAPQPAQSSSIKMVVTSVAPDGTALVHVVITRPFPEKEFAAKLPGGLLAARRNSVILASARKSWEEQSRYKEFDATLDRDGALLIAVDNSQQSDNIPKPTALTQAELAHVRDQIVAQVNSPTYQAKLAENEVAGTFTVPNVIALSCAKRASFAAGEAWRVVSKADNAIYDVSVVTGQETYLGHNAILLSAKSHFDSPNGSNSTEATVHYDPQAHLVLGMQSAVTSHIQVTGMTSTTTYDFDLKQ
jgi:hypothetical protein